VTRKKEDTPQNTEHPSCNPEVGYFIPQVFHKKTGLEIIPDRLKPKNLKQSKICQKLAVKKLKKCLQ